MLIEFKFGNYRSFRDEAVLSMEATGLGAFKDCLQKYGNTRILPSIAIYGKNGGGKSNVIRAFWLAAQFIRNAQRTQHENAEVPVSPFMLNDYSRNAPTSFEFTYVLNDVKYIYGFSGTKRKIMAEYLYHTPKGQKAIVFEREGQTFKFTEQKTKRKLISETVAENQLFFAVACTMNDTDCISAMQWFRENILFSRDYSDIPQQLIEHSNDPNMLKAIKTYAKDADFGIENVQFDFDSKEVSDLSELPDDLPTGVKAALNSFIQILAQTSNNSEVQLKTGKVTATSFHVGKTSAGKAEQFPLELSDESDGTRKLMALAPAIESALRNGGLLLVDEIERELHPMLVEYVIAKFQSRTSNPNNAQIIFTTHNTELMNETLIRKDQIYFVDKKQSDGSSELYTISEFATKTTDNIRKGYLLGKYGAIPNIEIQEVE